MKLFLKSVIVLLCYIAFMIKTHVKETAIKKGITTAYQLQKALGISPSVAAKLWKDDFEFISRTSLNRLCLLLKCSPSKLITFEPDKD